MVSVPDNLCLLCQIKISYAGAHLDMIEELSAIFSEVSLKGTEEVPPSQITKV